MHVIESTDTENEHQDNFCMPIRMHAEKGNLRSMDSLTSGIENMTIIRLPTLFTVTTPLSMNIF